MPETILQTYLNNQFIKTAEQENITKLKKAATEIQNRLSKKKEKIIPFTLVAIDPKIEESDPVVLEVERVIISKWSTFKNAVSATKDKPTNYIRAVILEALNGLSKNEELGAIIWHTGRNIISNYKIAKTERAVIEDLLKRVGNSVEATSRTYWGLNDSPEVLNFKSVSVNIKIGKAVQINEEELTSEIKAAVVHSGWSAHAGGGENPHHHGQHNWHWPKFLAERAGKGITEVVNKALRQQNKELSTISEAIQTELDNYVSNLQPYFEQISTTLVQGVVANNKRSQLLWWKQALYSNCLERTYRSLTPLEAAITMAVDLNNFVSPIYPVSVDYFLMETLKDVAKNETDSEILFIDLIKQTSDLPEDVKNIIHTLVKEGDGRKSFGTALANNLTGISNADILGETGIDGKTKISLAKLTTWIFHDLQAAKMSSTK